MSPHVPPTTRARLKRAAARARVLEPLYGVRLAWLNVRARGDGAVEGGGIPLPPPRLRTLVGGTPDAAHFLASGERAAAVVEDAAVAQGVARRTVLDFGCGCGRTLRHLSGWTSVSGCDVNPLLVDWCRKNLAGASFEVSSPHPPLPYEDGAFDLVYAISVFTHLTEERQRKWLAELSRILTPGGVLVATTHGDELAANALVPRQVHDYEEGRVVVVYPESEGKNLCAAYHPRGALAALADELEQVAFEPRGLEVQDVNVFRKPTA